MSGADTPETARARTRDRGAMSTACSGAQAEHRGLCCLASVRGGAWAGVRNETFKKEGRRIPEKEWGEGENEARLVKRGENSRRRKATASTAAEGRENWP